ncbi:MAG: glycerol-3-phosphate 1-O-acyltransferase PlsY [Castellaniella sp.]
MSPADLFSTLGLVLLAYVLGSIPFAVAFSRLMGLRDPRNYGSRNPGATNVLRSGNRTAAALTLLGDAGKGWLAVALAQTLGGTDLAVAAAAVAVFLGHAHSIFLGLRGGKGVATALGVLFAINIWLALATAATWLIIAYASRYSSLAAIVAAVFAPLYYVLGGNVVWPARPALATAITIIGVMLLFRHQANISRLMRGKESRIGQKKR